MKYLKNIAITLSIMIGTILILTLLITTLNYFNILGKDFVSIAKIIIIFLSLFIGGFIIGKKSTNKGWLEGVKLGLIFVFLLIIFNLILNNKIEFKNLLYYIILIISSMFGSMIGINKIEKN